MNTQDNVAVKFLKHWRGYNPGEIAAFSKEVADQLVAGKVAEQDGSSKARGGGRTPKAATPQPTAPESSTSSSGAPSGEGDDPRP